MRLKAQQPKISMLNISVLLVPNHTWLLTSSNSHQIQKTFVESAVDNNNAARMKDLYSLMTKQIHWTYFIFGCCAFRRHVENAGVFQTSMFARSSYFHVQIVPRFLFRRFYRNSKGHTKMLLWANCRSISKILALSLIAQNSRKLHRHFDMHITPR